MANWGTLKLKNRPRWAVVFRYGLPVHLVGIALTISVVTQLHNSPLRFLSYFVPLVVAITLWCAGTRPGLVALFLSCLGVAVLARNRFLASGFRRWSS
jgi:hypothetical protein